MKKLLPLSALLMFLACSKTRITSTPVLTTPGNSHTVILHLNGNGIANQTLPLQQAIDSCSAAGGGTLVLPQGTYMIGPIYMKSDVTLSLDTLATLLASGNMNDFIVGTKTFNIINGTNSSNTAIQNVSIKGKGTIDGNGSVWWAAYQANNNIARPRLIYIVNCNNLTLDGVTLQNSPSFHFVPNQCQNVTASNLKIFAPSTSPNTDGIDPSDCQGVTIYNCIIDDGDDNIAIKGGRINSVIGIGCQDLTVSNCTFLHGHGLSIGSETNDGVKNLTVTNCTFNGTTNGIRLKSLVGAGGAMQNLRYSGITMTNVLNPLIIDLNYNGSAPYPTDIPSVDGVYIDHLTVTGARNAGKMVGLTNSILQHISLTYMNISAQTGLVLTNAANITMSNYNINVTSGAPIIATNATGTGF